LRAVYLGDKGVIAHAKAGALLIDCSTTDVDSARAVAKAAAERGLSFLDAPVSGGVAGAEAGSLTFMAGGADKALAAAQPILMAMGKNVVHTGASGSGQAAKICNNLILGISMIGVCEAFVLAEQLGLAPTSCSPFSSTSSGQCWSLDHLLPGAGPGSLGPVQPELPAGLCRQDDAEGPQAGDRGRRKQKTEHRFRRIGQKSLRTFRPVRTWRSRFFGHYRGYSPKMTD
jgi:3-hydroxyisobutyrate dehydrogenase